MTTLIFVHGTGVREKRYVEQFKLLQRNAAKYWDGVEVVPCFWGDRLGVPDDAAAATVPAYDISRGGDLPVDQWRDERWVLLEVDPLYELRLLQAAYAERGAVELPGQEFDAQDRVEKYLDWSYALGDVPGLTATLAQLDLPPAAFAEAVRTVFDSRPARLAIELASGDDSELREALARAVTAAAIVAADAGEPGSFPLDAIGRDNLTMAVLDGLDGADLGIGRTLLQVSQELVLRMGVAGAIERRRGMIMDRVTPFAGDVLRYLAHGEAVRQFIAETVRSVSGPVVLLGHSLGGIASLDVLHLGMARVDLLVTVGSQGAYLHSLGALPSAPDGEVTPGRLPPWINVYDPGDLLSYLAEPVFGSAVSDTYLRSGVPFPRSHSTYFSLPAFYTGLRSRLPQ